MNTPAPKAMIPERRWESFSVTQTLLEEKADWMGRDPGFGGTVIMYFRVAGSLMRFSWFDYTLVSAAFFHCVVGLEGVLRLIYAEEEKGVSFKDLLDRAVTDSAISDAIFSDTAPLPKGFRVLIEKERVSHAQKLASLLPKLRNDYLHGEYLLSPAFLTLAIQVREAADGVWNQHSALKTSRCCKREVGH